MICKLLFASRDLIHQSNEILEVILSVVKKERLDKINNSIFYSKVFYIENLRILMLILDYINNIIVTLIKKI